MKKVFFTAIVLVAFTGVCKANEIALKETNVVLQADKEGTPAKQAADASKSKCLDIYKQVYAQLFAMDDPNCGITAWNIYNNCVSDQLAN